MSRLSLYDADHLLVAPGDFVVLDGLPFKMFGAHNKAICLAAGEQNTD